MLKAGIDTGIFTAHSCRAASTSAAENTGTSIKTIINSASWSTSSTFYKHYKKEIQTFYTNEKQNFGQEILQKL